MDETEVLKGMVIKLLDEIVNLKAAIAATQEVMIVHDICDAKELELLEEANRDGLLSSMEHLERFEG